MADYLSLAWATSSSRMISWGRSTTFAAALSSKSRLEPYSTTVTPAPAHCHRRWPRYRPPAALTTIAPAHDPAAAPSTDDHVGSHGYDADGYDADGYDADSDAEGPNVTVSGHEGDHMTALERTLSALERRRLANIASNHRMLAEMGIEDASVADCKASKA